MSYKKTISKIDKFLSGNRSKYVFGSRHDLAVEVIRFIRNHFSILDGGDSVVVEKDNMGKVRDVVSLLKSIVVERNLSRKDVDVLSDIALLIHNWNNNVGKDTSIGIDIKLIDGILTSYLSLSDLNEIAKIYISKYRQIKNSMIPSVELAKHYLKSFEVDASDE